VTTLVDPSVPRAGRSPTTTRRRLVQLRAGLLAATIAVLITSLSAFVGVQLVVDEVSIRTAPAVLEVVAARAALVRADSAAVTSFETGQVQLIGPGEQYQNEIALASQSLAQVAEHNAAGATGSSTLQLVEGLLVAYTGLIEQADVHFRQDDATALGVADLWYASRLLHQPKDGILAQLNGLQEAQHTVLQNQLSDGWMHPATVLVWVVPIVVLAGLLCLTQVFLKRRFQRLLNAPLLAASVLLLVLAAGTSYALVLSQDRSGDGGDTLNQVLQEWQAQTDATDASGQHALADVVQVQCGGTDGGCGDTVTGFVARLAASPGNEAKDWQAISKTKKVNEELLSADQSGILEFAIPGAALGIAALVLLGLQPRIDEYRYRSP